VFCLYAEVYLFLTDVHGSVMDIQELYRTLLWICVEVLFKV